MVGKEKKKGMKGKTSKLAKKIQRKYGKTKIGETYKIDGKSYKLTDGNIDEIIKEVDQFIKKRKTNNIKW